MLTAKLPDAPEKLNPVRSYLNTVLKEMMLILKAECGSLFLFDQERNELVLKAFMNSRPIDVAYIKRRIGEGISGKVAQNRVPLLVKDIDQDGRVTSNGYDHYHTKSFISVPLVCADSLLGLVNIADKESGESFTERDLQFIIALSKYAAANADHIAKADAMAKEQEQLKQQKRMLEKYASMGKLAAGVVHEINNPLDGIIRYTNILLGQLYDHSVARDYLTEVKKGLDRITNITKGLLDFSHVVSGNTAKTVRFVDIHTVLDDCLDTLKHMNAYRIQVFKAYCVGMPLLKDMGISHALINIIKNAFQAMQQGGSLEIATAVGEDEISISISDSGSGIPPEVKEKIFDPFFTTKSIDSGTGLGLAIAKEIINNYEGKIEVVSLPGMGTTFKIVIPKKHTQTNG